MPDVNEYDDKNSTILILHHVADNMIHHADDAINEFEAKFDPDRLINKISAKLLNNDFLINKIIQSQDSNSNYGYSETKLDKTRIQKMIYDVANEMIQHAKPAVSDIKHKFDPNDLMRKLTSRILNKYFPLDKLRPEGLALQT